MHQRRMIRCLIAVLLTITILFSFVGVIAEGKLVLQPGTYQGTASGFGGELALEVTVTADAISEIKVVSHSETEGIGTVAIEKLPAAIVEAQSLKEDAISGCTVTSEAILAAAKQALLAAGATEEMLGESSSAVSSETTSEAETIITDVVIVGAGASGLSAALSAYQNGVRNMVVIEKMPFVGGSTATAGGGMQIYRVDADPDVTQKNLEELFLYWCRTGKFTNNARLTMLAAKLSAPTFEWLKEQGTDLSYTIDETKPTFHVGSPGRAAGMINTLYEKVQAAGIPVILETRAEHLLTEGGRVVGVVAKGAKGQQVTILAQAVLLATGGYGNNADLIPDSMGDVIYYGPVCPTGDGHMMVKEIGVPLFNMDKLAIKHFGIETAPGYGIHIHWAVAKIFSSTSAIAVNKEGKRVVNEGGDEMDIALASMHKSSDGRLYIVMDQAAYDVYSDVLINYKAFTREQLDAMIAANGEGITKLVKNDSLAGAAEAIGVDAKALEQTVKDYNADVAVGKDEFKRSFVAEFGEGPYYIMQTVPRFATSLGGVNVTDNLEVLDVNEQPVPGLFAAGEVVGNVNGSYAHYLIWCFGAGKLFGDVIPSYLK
jgi:urocanate reductase